MEDGSYSNIDFGGCTGHASYASNVVFEPEPGHECPMTYPSVPSTATTSCAVSFHFANDGFVGGSSSSCGVTGNPLPHTLSDAQRSSWINHLTIRGIYLNAFEMHCAANINLTNDVGTTFYIRQGAFNVTVDGGDYNTDTTASQPTIGDSTNSSGNWPPAEGITIRNAIVRDFTSSGPGHGDGYFIQPAYDVHIIKNIIARNDCIPFYVNYAVNASTWRSWAVDRRKRDPCLDSAHNRQRSLPKSREPRREHADRHDHRVQQPRGRHFRHDPANGTTVANNQIVGNVATRSDDDSGAGCEPGYSVKYNVFYDSWASNCGDSSNALANAQQFASYDTAGWTARLATASTESPRSAITAFAQEPPPSARCRPVGATPILASARPPTSTAIRGPTLRTPPITMPAPTRTADGAARLVDAKQPSDEVADTQGRRDADGRHFVAWSSGGPASARFHRSPASPSG